MPLMYSGIVMLGKSLDDAVTDLIRAYGPFICRVRAAFASHGLS
jgi:hypothetical protein